MRKSVLEFVGPGFMVAATGIGAGDMIASSVAGANFGMLILWTALLGGVLKYVLNENIARWQLATNTTLLTGWVQNLPQIVSAYFFLYLILWSLVVGATLISFCGLAAHTIFPIHHQDHQSVFIWGTIHSLIGCLLVWNGKYNFLEQFMKVFIITLFLTVLIGAIMMQPNWIDVLQGILIPRLPHQEGAYLFILGVIGGVGGSVTLLSYAYWLNEKGWSGGAAIGKIRIDLGVAYLMTALFGIAIMIIASQVEPEKVQGYQMILSISQGLEDNMGWIGKWIFIWGFWGAVASSLIGVWNGVPYLFADFVQQFRLKRQGISHSLTGTVVDIKSKEYRIFLLFLTFAPLIIVGLGKPVWIGITYAVTGAFFMPFLATLLLYMNNQKKWMKNLNNSLVSNFALVLILLFFMTIIIMRN